MRQLPLTLLGTALLLPCAVALVAAPTGESLEQMSQNPDQRVLPGGNYPVIRHSKLDKINTSNVDNLHVSRTMSTGTLRG
jgi:glucose dehydrogenase